MGSRHRAGADLQHVRWIGGGSVAGKSTVARQLAADHGLRLYHTEPFSKYVGRADPGATPLLQGFMAMDMDERWVNRSPAVMLETFHGFQGEGFRLVLEDLRALPADPPVLAEGFSLLPRLVAPLLSRPRQAVWLLPTPEFRRTAFESRGSTWTIPAKTSDPQRLWRICSRAISCSRSSFEPTRERLGYRPWTSTAAPMWPRRLPGWGRRWGCDGAQPN
ncbi:MAG TPA: hypothetical protein VFM47_07310 [Gaiellales bacterium]|nr:hypothetical protein [Gaiellales bacterium]